MGFNDHSALVQRIHTLPSLLSRTSVVRTKARQTYKTSIQHSTFLCPLLPISNEHGKISQILLSHYLILTLSIWSESLPQQTTPMPLPPHSPPDTSTHPTSRQAPLLILTPQKSEGLHLRVFSLSPGVFPIVFILSYFHIGKQVERKINRQ